MKKRFKQLQFQPRYDGSKEDLFECFFCSVSEINKDYRRIVDGFSYQKIQAAFSSIYDVTNTGTEIKIVLREQIDKAEWDELSNIQSSTALKDEILSILINRIADTKKDAPLSKNIFNVNDLQKYQISAKVVLNIKKNKNSSEKQVNKEKIATLTDSYGDSINYSRTKYDLNGDEVVSVKWSWGDPSNAVNNKIRHFDNLWQGNLKELKVFNLHEKAILKIVNELNENSKVKSFKLYDHQEKAINSWINNSFRGIFKMCTGAGKTIAALSGLIELNNTLKKKGTGLGVAVVICPKKILVEQWKREVISFGFQKTPLLAYDSIGKYSSFLPVYLDETRHDGLRIVITTNDTFSSHYFGNHIEHAKRSGTEALIIADEMHNFSSSAQRSILNKYKDYFRYRLGLSATPEIEGKETATRELFKFFGPIVGEFELPEAIKRGVLCPYKYYPKPVFMDPLTSKKYYTVLKGISELKGRIDISLYTEKSEIIRKSGVYYQALKEIIKDLEINNEDLSHTLTFCPPGKDDTDEDSRLIEGVKAIYQNADLLCRSITAETPHNDRPEILEMFGNGSFHILLAIGCLDEGFDLPSTMRAIMLYSIDRERQFVQRRGRVLRKSKGKKYAIIHDIIILPHNSDLEPTQAEKLLYKEMRRYRKFSKLAINSDEANKIMNEALSTAMIGGK